MRHWGACPWVERARGGDERTRPELGRARVRRLAGSGTASPMGKRDPARSLAAFPVSEVPAPARRRQLSPEGERMVVGKLRVRAHWGSELPELWRGGGGRDPSSLFPTACVPGLGDPRRFNSNLVERLAGGCCHFARGLGGPRSGGMGKGSLGS